MDTATILEKNNPFVRSKEATDAPATAMTARDVHLFYGEHEALKGINMDFYPNTITALIGPSGCGKSTFLRCLNRMNDLIPNVKITGKIEYRGRDIYAPSTNLVNLRTKIGMVFQQPNPFPFSIFDNVAYGLNLRGHQHHAELAKVVESALKRSAIWEEVKDRLNKNALSLSGGQQQRVCIARVLAVSPDIILLDEPTSALDPISTLQIEQTLLKLKKDFTIIIVTHNLQQAERIADYTAFMLNGNLIEKGRTQELFNNPKEQQTSDYLTGKFG